MLNKKQRKNARIGFKLQLDNIIIHFWTDSEQAQNNLYSSVSLIPLTNN